MTDAFNIKQDKSFLRSALIDGNPWGGVVDAAAWLAERTKASRFQVTLIPFNTMSQWSFDQHTGNLLHQSGRFFSIEGMHVDYVSSSLSASWDQPIIVQPEIGILGIVTKVVDGVRYFLMQAKSEPGNVTIVQLSPTVQATESNLSQVHHGKRPRYLDYFLDRRKFTTIVDQLLSEQGSRFFQKRNRNIIVEVFEDIELHEDFCWLTLRQIRNLARLDNVINMDARSVLSCLPPYLQTSDADNIPAILSSITTSLVLSDFARSVLMSECNANALHTLEHIAGWFAALKSTVDMTVSLMPLNEVKDWVKTTVDIHHATKPFFSVVAVAVSDDSREVTAWNQPLLKDDAQGVLGFLCANINGTLHFLVQGKFEAGNLDGLEMAPTLSCSNLEYKKISAPNTPFLDYFVNPRAAWLRHHSVQSEEGGRFYHLQNRNMIIELPEAEIPLIPDNYCWMTLYQIRSSQQRGVVNIDLRTLLSCLSLEGV